MATNFTTWASLYSTMLDKLADFVANGTFIGESYSVGDKSVNYRSIDEFRKGLQWVKFMADTESGAAVGRTYAKNGGGGRW